MSHSLQDASRQGATGSRFQRALPGLTLMVLAPLVAELLPGATRVSAWFVLPIEILIWGGGTLLIRDVVRRLQLGWRNMLLLALALAVAEECLIQQTSLAPLVIKIKGVEYARAMGVNYVYLLWALMYEAIFVVFVPVGLAELIFRRRRAEGWLNAAGASVVALLFLPACGMAWFTWTQIARKEVFHVETYNPPASQAAIAAAVIGLFVVLAIGPTRNWLARPSRGLRPLHPWGVAALAGAAVVVLFGLEVLAFGIAPEFPPLAAVAIGVTLGALLIAFVPRLVVHESWTTWHQVALLYGALVTNMAIFFIAFIDATRVDFYGKVVLDVVAVALLAGLAVRLRRGEMMRGEGFAGGRAEVCRRAL